MQRLFVALSLPEIISDALMQLQSGLDGAHWREIDHFHLTLAFIGDVDRREMEEVASALADLKCDPLEITLRGCDFFGSRKPRAAWVGVERNCALDHLQNKIETALRRTGIRLERRKFIPHITLAYLKGVLQSDVAKWSAMHGLFSVGPFPVDEFHLYDSRRGGELSHYDLIESYPLSSSR